MIKARLGRYCFGLAQELAPAQLESLVKLLEEPFSPGKKVLAGRAEATIGPVAKLGRVAVKHYLRGGLLQYFVRRHYNRLGVLRPRLEFERLEQVRALGVSAPQPIAYAYRGNLWYEAWLFTKEIESCKSLSELACEGLGNLDEIMDQLAQQIEILIANGIQHVDLHPGNVLITSDSKVFIVDFDRANKFRGDARSLREHYICRWRRAVIKHRLPDELSEMMSLRLRKY